MYQVIDYHTGKPVIHKVFNTEDEAYQASREYLTKQYEEKVIHNNLLCIEEVVC